MCDIECSNGGRSNPVLITGADIDCTLLKVGACWADMLAEALCECKRGRRNGGSDIMDCEDVFAYVADLGLVINDGDGFEVGGRDEFLEDCG